jgi:UDP-2,4-diacetamido-2,4,6-trideoxy-beta-L-altropyranose hydrolase
MEEHQIVLHRATMEDAEILFKWANDPVVRSYSFSSEPIIWENHLKWLSNKLSSLNSVIYIGSVDNQKIGQIRFDIIDEIAEIGISVDQKFRGKGFGFSLLTYAISCFFCEFQIQIVQAKIKSNNFASKQIFEHAGFHRTGNLLIDNNLVIIMQLQKT